MKKFKRRTLWPVIAGLFLYIPALIFLGLEARRQNVVYEYYALTGYYADIRYGPGCLYYAETINRTVDIYYPYLLADFELSEEVRPKIIVYPTPEALYLGAGVDYGTKPPMGVYYSGVIHILSPENWVGDTENETDAFLSQGPVIHELSHFLLDKKTRGNYEVWFSEGVALYTEYKYIGFEWRYETDETHKAVSFSNMNVYFKESDQAAAYGAAFEKINNLVVTYGEKALLEIYSRLEQGNAFSMAAAGY